MEHDSDAGAHGTTSVPDFAKQPSAGSRRVAVARAGAGPSNPAVACSKGRLEHGKPVRIILEVRVPYVDVNGGCDVPCAP